MALTLHEQILVFFNIRQGLGETDDKYIEHFNARLKSLELVGRKHIFCSLHILKKELSAATPEEIQAENKRLQAMCFLV